MATPNSEIPTMASALSAPIWPMISISKQKLIFPPSNHENLTIPHDDSFSDSDLTSDSDSNSSSTFSPVILSPKSSPVVNEVSSMRFVSWAITTLCSRFYKVVKYLWSSFSFTRNASLKSALVVLCFLYYRQRRRLRDGDNARSGLIRVIGEKEDVGFDSCVHCLFSTRSVCGNVTDISRRFGNEAILIFRKSNASTICFAENQSTVGSSIADESGFIGAS